MSRNYYTSYYANWRNFPKDAVQVSISNSTPNTVAFKLYCIVPDWNTIVKPFKDGLITEEDYRKLYHAQLDQNRSEIESSLRSIETVEWFNNHNNIIFLCYCKTGKFCHRHIFAEWMKRTLGINIVEL